MIGGEGLRRPYAANLDRLLGMVDVRKCIRTRIPVEEWEDHAMMRSVGTAGDFTFLIHERGVSLRLCAGIPIPASTSHLVLRSMGW